MNIENVSKTTEQDYSVQLDFHTQQCHSGLIYSQIAQGIQEDHGNY